MGLYAVSLNGFAQSDTSYSVLFRRANAHFNQKEYQEALRDYSRALRISPESSELYNNRGMAKEGLGNAGAAMDDYEKAIQLDPQNAMAYNNQGIAYYRQGNFTEAKKMLDLAMEHERKSPMIHNNMGLVLVAEGKPRIALLEFEKAFRIDNRYVAAYLNRARTYRDLKMYKEAIEDCTAGLSVCEKGMGTDLLILRANVYDLQGEPTLALGDFFEALQIMPTSVEALLGRGTVKQRLGDLNGALVECESALAIAPGNPMAHTQRGILLAKLGEPQKALRDLNQAERLGSPSHQLYATRGSLYLSLGNPQKAMNDLNRAIEIFPKSASAHESLGIVYLQYRDFQKSLEAFGRALKYAQTQEAEASILFNRATAKANLGQFSEAMADLAKANDMCSDQRLKDAIQEFRLKLVEKGG